MNLPIVYYNREEYVETATGNKIVRKESTISGTQTIRLNRKCFVQNSVTIRGDLAAIRCGKYSMIQSGTVIRPGYKAFSKGVTMFPVQIGDHAMIEENCIISVEKVSSFVHIGKGSVIGRGVILKECSRVLPGSVIPPGTTFAPFSIIGGYPGLFYCN